MKLHFIGIAGTGMGNAAGLFARMGFEVRGSDEAVYPPMSDVLDHAGISVMTPYSAENLNWAPDLVVVGNICRKDHIEVLEAQRRGLPLTSFPALLGKTVLNSSNVTVVAGTHGKTTTSSMLAWIMHFAGVDPGYLIGGVPNDLPGSYEKGCGNGFVIEGDEYDTAFFDKNPKFIHYRPKNVLLTGVEFDHADIYRDLDHVKEQFYRLRALCPPDGVFISAIENDFAADLARKTGGVTYGIYGEDAHFTGEVIDENKSFRTVRFRKGSTIIGDYLLKLTGLHNLRNSIGALGCAVSQELDPELCLKAVGEFNGVKRRQEIVGSVNNITIIDDFGHHPSAVKLTLEGLRKRFEGRIISVFEPRSATSRRKVFQKAYSEAFDLSDAVFISAPFDQSRISEDDRFDSDKLATDLRARGLDSYIEKGYENIRVRILNFVEPGDTIVFFSSGSFGGIRTELLNNLEKKYS
ncbi:UDP-N-acetylmuramate:L-alanyl-gamma-D-glutamyl-meso-diaminopimelate ligase [Myxococcota bacterium]|nr:UDP-N-acetylmuramate:L-alanyl-gamma-D-glutamyl-meso-diaminopimelate ligase [Myxococcota bacterium]MBU1379738.1 UDP-N-acetylmuramate:L-alanyl-gamma-D-glutamyl-meso-diaminopimelate ligase [Myxococcota bacterium]MBU1498549.1 UDP-N-acetylmuramate:L-alanyl-gamma-D-glutamyl-meso-diaminopimelate ligase [Myxococcota bacterium]